jgi:copper(I)-binding protein
LIAFREGMTMHRLLPLLASAALAGCGSGSTYSSVSISNPVVRLPAVAGRPAAGYATIAATADRVALVGVSSPSAGRVEMHETMRSGTMSKMRPIDRIDLVAEPEIAFAPGGRHLMLIDVDPRLKAGDRAQLTFRFAHGDPVSIRARVIGAGDDVPR